MTNVKKTMHGDICVADYGQPEYLDGAMMQFTVTDGAYPRGETLAFFGSAEDAEIFAKAKARAKKNVGTSGSTSAQNGHRKCHTLTDNDRH